MNQVRPNYENDRGMAIDEAMQEPSRKLEDSLGFDSRVLTEGGDNSVKIGHVRSMEDNGAHANTCAASLAEGKADKDLAMVAGQLGFEGMLFRQNIQPGGYDPLESTEWIHFYPGKSICVVHDCSSFRGLSSSEQQQPEPTNSNPTPTFMPCPAVPKSTDVSESLWRQSWDEMKGFILEQNQSLRQEVKEMNNTIVACLQHQQVRPVNRSTSTEQSWPGARSTRTDHLSNKITSTGSKQLKTGKPAPQESISLSLLTDSSLKNSYPSQGGISRLGRSHERPSGEDDYYSSSKERHLAPSSAYLKPNYWSGRDAAHTPRSDWDRRRVRRGMWRDSSRRCYTETSEIDKYIPKLGDRRTRDTKKSKVASDSTEERRAHMSSTNTRAFRFAESDLEKFVEDCKGSILSDTLAVSISLKSPQEALSFYKFLASIDYHGRYLNIRLAWDWSQHDMEDLVSAIEVSNIRTLCLNCDKSRSEPDKSISSKSRHDPLVSLLGVRTLTDLRLIAVPEILRESRVRIPSCMSHLSTLRIQLDASTQYARFIDVIKRATCLRQLILDSLPDCYREYLELIKQALVQDRRGYEYRQHSSGAPTSTDIQFNRLGYAVLIVKIDRATGELGELSLDLRGAKADQIKWRPIFSSGVLTPLASLTTLRLKSPNDSSWAPFLLELIKVNRCSYDSQDERHLDVRRMKILDLRVDCKTLWSSGLQDMCDLLFHIRSTLLRLKLTNLNFPTIVAKEKKLTTLKGKKSKEEGELSSSAGSSETRGWAYFFKSLRFSVLERLQIEDTNLGDADMKTLVKCFESRTSWDQRYGLNKLVLFNTNVTARGMKELIVASDRNRWNIKIDIRDGENSRSA
ncbi:hypothetical protein BGX26_007580 [Mortierella sp. AD094]|nr:hypothetical protein BGX26_007580 [Mortierella sp. AD094]